MTDYTKQPTGEQLVEEQLAESRAERERARLMLTDSRDIAEAWVCVKPTTAEISKKLDELAEMIRETVVECWGERARVEFETDPRRRVVASHSDGRRLVLAVDHER